MRESSLELVDVVARSPPWAQVSRDVCATSVGHFDASYTVKGCTAYLSASHRKTERRENNASD
jgi:hypothetical protein